MLRPLRSLTLLAVCLSILLGGRAAAAPRELHLEMRSGGEFVGTVVSHDGEAFSLRRTGGGELRILWDDLTPASFVAARRSVTPQDAAIEFLGLARYAADHELRVPAEELLAAALRADKEIAGGVPGVQRAIATLRLAEVEELVSRGKDLIEDHEYLQALGRFRDAAKMDATHAWAVNGAGEACYHLRRLGDAREYVEQAIALDPACKDALFREAYLDLIELDFQGCLDGLDRLLELPPEEGRVATRAELARRVQEAEEKPASMEEAFEKWADSTLVEGNDLRPVIAGIVKGPGFETEFVAETEHYVVRTDVTQDYAELLASRLELIHKEYERQYSFSKTGKSKTRGKGLKFPVLVFKDRKGYVGWFTRVLRNPLMAKQTGGVYVPLVKHLVFFKNKKFEDTQLVAWHEAFHQYIDYYVAGAPHWFNEGQAEYFGASTLRKSGKTVDVGQTNSWRIGILERMLQNGRLPRTEELMQRTAQVFMGGVPKHDPRYSGKRLNSPVENYTASWALVHFLVDGQKRRHQKKLMRYFRELCDGVPHAEAFLTAFGRVKWDKFNEDFGSHCVWLVQRWRAEKKGTEVPDMPR